MGFEVVAYTRELLAEFDRDHVIARALGGVGVALTCVSATKAPLAREYHDLDLATTRRHGHRLSDALIRAGCEAAERFNALHGHSRMMFTLPNRCHVDVLVQEFVMCHKLDLGSRLTVCRETIPVADLLLTKLQIAQINHKDVLDIAALLVDHPVTENDDGINASYIGGLLSDDWGWWRTVTENLVVVDELLPSLGLQRDDEERANGRLHELNAAISHRKRSLRWRARARVGERLAWRLDPEEVIT
jgi:hypothetical protein